MSRSYTVACLAGDGVGSELIGEATRALRAVSSLHGFAVEELHVPFGSESFNRMGHRLPPETRLACRRADAILVGMARDEALHGLVAELELEARVSRVRVGSSSDVMLVSALAEESEPWAIERAFQIAQSRRASITAVGVGERWRALVDEAAARHQPTEVAHVSFADALAQLAPAAAIADVVLAEATLAETLEAVIASGATDTRVSATGRLAATGPGLFFPTHGAAFAIAGYGVANPNGMLLATALMLGEGLNERAAARTLVRAISDVVGSGLWTQDMLRTGVASTTREFVDVVLGELHRARRDVEFFPVDVPA
jgi:3-isopropylmalate dehydrogenase